MEIVLIFAQKLFETLESFSVYLLLGFFLSAVLRLFIKPTTIQKWLGKRNASSVVMASLIGVPMPLCSCSVIPVGVSLRKSGASDGATLSFLTSTPVTGVDSIAMSMAMLPMPLAIARPIVALVLGLLSGLCQILFFKEDKGAFAQVSVEAPLPFKDSLKECFDYVAFDLFPSLANTLFLGVLLAAILLTGIELKYVPDISTISTGSLVLDMVIVILMGIPVYVCATGSTPIAAALIMAGMKPELAFVFLIAGPATNITTITTVVSLFKVRTMILYLGVIFLGSILAGWGLGYFWGDALEPVKSHLSHQHEEGSVAWLVAAATWFMIGAFTLHYFFAFKFKLSHMKKGQGAFELNLLIEGMTCQNCVKKIEGALSAFSDLSIGDVDIENHKIKLISNRLIEENPIVEKLQSVGFTAVVLNEKKHSLNLKIESMTCQNCVRKIEGVLFEFSPVKIKEVDVATKLIEFESPEEIDVLAIKSRLKEAGFDAEEIASDCCH